VSEVLLGKRNLEETLQYVELPSQPSGVQTGLYFLGTGADVANPAELLGTGRTARLLGALAAQAELVLIDTPPVLPVADTLVIGRIASGALLVTAARSSSTIAVSKAKDLLIRNQTRLFGVVLNKFQEKDASFGYGYGYYGSSPSQGPQEVGTEPPSPNGASSAHTVQSL
jgi:Mrp family chromosome partitioning ATPase